jgi:hypothetical protein
MIADVPPSVADQRIGRVCNTDQNVVDTPADGQLNRRW